MAYSGFDNNNNQGKVTYDESILNGIVALAVSSVDGVAMKVNKKGEKALKEAVKIVSDKNGIHVRVMVDVKYGYSIPDVAFDIQHGVKQTVEEMSRYHIANVDVYIDNILFEDKAVL